MLFNSLPFIFFFLPITAIIYFWLGKSRDYFLQMIWLSTMSFVFYAYWNKMYLILLLGSVCMNFSFGQYLQANKRKFILILGIIFNLSVLAYFKYWGFFLKNINTVTGSHIHWHAIALPLGISFITFQKITYLVDCYRGRIKESNFLRFLAFISFFPQLIAGPIVHYGQLMPQFKRKPKVFSSYYFNIGLSFFVFGLTKKLLLADTAALFADPLFTAMANKAHLTFQETWVGVLAYSFQIYFDFSGYSDMAIGLAYMFGIKLPFNFNSPYKAVNIIDFWRRWHMTLSFFLRDYVYIPLGGNRHGELRKFYNLMITMLLGGLWHGANWTFVIWGAMHGFMLIINHLWISLKQKFGFALNHHAQWWYQRLMIGFTFLCVTIAWVFFRAPSIKIAKRTLGGLIGLNGFGISEGSYLYSTPILTLLQTIAPSSHTELLGYGVAVYLMFMLTLLWFLPNSQQLIKRKNLTPTYFRGLKWRPSVFHFVGINFLFIVCLATLSTFEVKLFQYFAF